MSFFGNRFVFFALLSLKSLSLWSFQKLKRFYLKLFFFLCYSLVCLFLFEVSFDVSLFLRNSIWMRTLIPLFLLFCFFSLLTRSFWNKFLSCTLFWRKRAIAGLRRLYFFFFGLFQSLLRIEWPLFFFGQTVSFNT